MGAVQGATTADLNPAAIAITLQKDIKWVEGRGSDNAILAGDPTKPGLYVELTRWHKNSNSRPHSHPYDRYITVLSGTWWVATGTEYNLDRMVPLPAGTHVTHFAKEIHWDGAKDEECVLEIVGMGPANSTQPQGK
jgi:quercetin dioxygenase-like cupin family protein